MSSSLEDRNQLLNETVRRIRIWESGEISGPVQIDAELHRRCNLTCSYCSRERTPFDLHEHSRFIELPVQRWIKFVNESADMGVLSWNLEGSNEPSAVPHLFWPVISRIKERGMFGNMTTNGTLWNTQGCKKIVELGWDRIHISVEGHDSRIHDAHRGKGMFIRTLKTIKLIKEFMNRLKTDRPFICINTVVTRINYPILSEMIELCSMLEVPYFFTEPCIPYTPLAESFKVPEEESEALSEAVNGAFERAKELGIQTNLYQTANGVVARKTGNMQPFIRDGKLPCFKPWQFMAIKADGRVGHCGLLEGGTTSDNKSLSEIWAGNFFMKARSHYKAGNLYSHCSYCAPSDVHHRNILRELLNESKETEVLSVRIK